MKLKEFFKSLEMKMPEVRVEGSKKTQTDFFPFSPNPIVTEIDSVRGDIDLAFETPSGIQFGGGITPRFFEGEVNFPQDVQDMGAPASQKFGSGLTLDQIRAFLNLPVDDTSSVLLGTQFSSDITERPDINLKYEKRF
tara:strand:+ start:2717 stop:3130 length:414 start_codon:yes stop_codon:yes gene_type:complete